MTRPLDPSAPTRKLRGLLRTLCLALPCLLLQACANTREERHLAPLYTQISRAGGGVEEEALAGAVRLRRDSPGGTLRQWGLRPLVIREKGENGDWLMRYLTPFGRAERKDKDFGWYLLPITLYTSQKQPQGEDTYTLITLPGIYWSRTDDGRTLRAWFPFGGVLERFVSFDRIEFALFPLWVRTERAGRETTHVLWPFFSKSSGAGGPAWRAWPLIGHGQYEDRYDRWFFLWPFFQWEHNRQWAGEERDERSWMVFPLYGYKRAGSYRAHTLLWPFFGWSSDPEQGFWAWDAPWPFVRMLENPAQDERRRRVWPFYSYYRGDGMESTWYLWPFYNSSYEEYPDAVRTTRWVLPLWQEWHRKADNGETTDYRKLWPLFEIDQGEPGLRRTAFPALNPLWRTPEIDEMYAWIWELYAREERPGGIRSERSWLGLYRRERDANEDRRSWVGLWANRQWQDTKGVERSDTALLFGLLRWSSGADGSLEWLAPALPGPGWPLERTVRNRAP